MIRLECKKKSESGEGVIGPLGATFRRWDLDGNGWNITGDQ